LQAPRNDEKPEEDAPDEPSLDPAAVSALQALMQTMQGEEA